MALGNIVTGLFTKYLKPDELASLSKAPKAYGEVGTERALLGLDTEEALQAYKDQMTYTKGIGEVPQNLSEEAKKLYFPPNDEIPPETEKEARDLYFNTREEFRKYVDENAPYSFHEEAPPAYEYKDLAAALASNKINKGLIGVTKDLEDFEQVAVRFDIPAYTGSGVYTVTVHDKEGKKVLGYAPTALLTKVEMPSEAAKSKKTAETRKKSPFITMKGQWVNHNPKQLRELADRLVKENKDKLLDEQEWVQVSVNPGKSGSFVSVSKNADGKIESFPVNEAEAVIQIGKLILMKPYKPGKQMTWKDYYSKNIFGIAPAIGLGAATQDPFVPYEDMMYKDPFPDTTEEPY